MKNVCTPETARALEAAGFPQPEPEPGQVWYNTFGTPYVILSVIAPGVLLAVDMKQEVMRNRYMRVNCFAPTAADVLRELPEGSKISWWNDSEGAEWECESDSLFYHSNSPAEACAAAWLALNQKDTPGE